MIYIGFPILSLVYLIIFLILYFSKKRIDLFENKIVISMMILNGIGLVLELGCYLVLLFLKCQDSFFGMFILKSYIAYIPFFNWILTGYVFLVTSKYYGKQEEDVVNYFKKILLLFFPLTLVLIFSAYFFKLYCYNVYPKYYTYGFCTKLILYSMIVLFPTWIFRCFVSLLHTKKGSRIKMFLLLVGIILIGSSGALTQMVDKSVLIITSAETIMLTLIYFTIENPDVKMIEQLEIAKEEADKANHAKTDFLSSMSHEIRTPLNAISGFSNCIMEAKSLEEAKENAKDIVDASNTLLEIVNGILDVSKIEAGKMDIVSSPYDSNDVFTELAKLITPKMKEKGLDFSYYIAPDIPKTLYGDHANIKKVITNLLSNACKYTDNGFVRYEVNCVNMRNYTRLIISVEDSGRGIKKQNIEKLFTKFQRLEEDRNTTIEGTGLGLAITKQLTELMGGKVILHTIYGKGSKFTIVINQKISDKTIEDDKKYKTTLDLKDVKILLVDDNVLNIKVAKKLLEMFNANNITTCSSGFECIKKIKESLDYDIILLDDMMPKKSGVETLKELKEINGFKIPTIALTANAITGMKEKYLSEGFDNYLAKPIEKEELIRVINETLGRVVTEQMPIVEDEEVTSEEINDESKENEIIPVEDDIENELGEKLDLSFEVDEDNLLKESSVHVDHFEDEDVLNEVNSISTIPLVGSDVSTDVIEKVDVNYLKDNGVDIDFALDLLGDMDMYNSTVHDFVDEVDDKWKRIVEYKNSSDMENYAIEVHSLKSDAKYLGLMKLAEVAYKHELKSKEKDIDFVNNHFSELEEEYNKSIDIIKKYAKDN